MISIWSTKWVAWQNRCCFVALSHRGGASGGVANRHLFLRLPNWTKCVWNCSGCGFGKTLRQLLLYNDAIHDSSLPFHTMHYVCHEKHVCCLFFSTWKFGLFWSIKTVTQRPAGNPYLATCYIWHTIERINLFSQMSSKTETLTMIFVFCIRGHIAHQFFSQQSYSFSRFPYLKF